MKLLVALGIFVSLGTSAFAVPATLSVTSKSFANGHMIPPQFANCQYDKTLKTINGGNINPQLSWSGAPKDTKSYALIMVDPDVPASFVDANKEGKSLPTTMPRMNFYHWLLTDIPTSVTSIAEGQDSKEVLPGGKPIGKRDYGITYANDYKNFAGGQHGGYDGPCPPWNDDQIHSYRIRVYALNVDSLNLKPDATGKEVEEAVLKHAVAMGEWIGSYTTNAKYLAPPKQ